MVQDHEHGVVRVLVKIAILTTRSCLMFRALRRCRSSVAPHARSHALYTTVRCPSPPNSAAASSARCLPVPVSGFLVFRCVYVYSVTFAPRTA
ncbi:hypothetical protein RSAG8_04465, partial [Rhizoctonia solani AG-8 WAC10335]